MFSRAMALGATLLLVCLAGTASADRLVDYDHNHVDGATIAAKLWQRGGADRALYVEVRMRNTRRAPGCISGVVRWHNGVSDVVDNKTEAPLDNRTQAPQPGVIRACPKKTWINLGRTPLRSVRDFSGVSTYVNVEGREGKWSEMIRWDRAAIKRQADGIMKLSYRDFIKRKTEAMRNRSQAGARADKTWPLDWSDDGCGIPGRQSVDLVRKFARGFDKACQQHDFGYRNYGGSSLALNRSEGTRRRIDQKQLGEMRRACKNLPFELRLACPSAATGIYKGVRTVGSRAFYGQE